MIIIISIIILCISVFLLYKAHQYLEKGKIKQFNAEELIKRSESIQIKRKEQQHQLNKEIENLSSVKAKLLNDITSWEKENVTLKEKAKQQIQDQINIYKQQAKHEMVQYIKTVQLEKKQYQNQLNLIKNELEKIKSTKKATQEALLKQQEIKENKEHYCLIPTPEDLDDIEQLFKIKKYLHHPRILSMLIWQTYWQPLAKKQFPLILHSDSVGGIYKITNLITEECYIGQSVDIYKRWCQHCKCGLGIDTPAGNKLYKAIQEIGLENFSFQVLEECSNLELNEKEKYYINLYDSCNFGYNGNMGIKNVRKN